jgi:hypothetical protein
MNDDGQFCYAADANVALQRYSEYFSVYFVKCLPYWKKLRGSIDVYILRYKLFYDEPLLRKSKISTADSCKVDFIFNRYEVKVKLSLCLTKHHAMKEYWRSGGIAPQIP